MARIVLSLVRDAAEREPDPFVSHQLDLITPGISPSSASLRKQMRQSWNFRR
jgi:hypothetical protein